MNGDLWIVSQCFFAFPHEVAHRAMEHQALGNKEQALVTQTNPLSKKSSPKATYMMILKEIISGLNPVWEGGGVTKAEVSGFWHHAGPRCAMSPTWDRTPAGAHSPSHQCQCPGVSNRTQLLTPSCSGTNPADSFRGKILTWQAVRSRKALTLCCGFSSSQHSTGMFWNSFAVKLQQNLNTEQEFWCVCRVRKIIFM